MNFLSLDWNKVLDISGVAGVVFIALVFIIFWIMRSNIKTLNTIMSMLSKQLSDYNAQMVENTVETHRVALKMEELTQLLLKFILKKDAKIEELQNKKKEEK